MLLLSGLLLYWRLRIITRTITTAAARCAGRILASFSLLLLLLLVVGLAGWLAFTGRKASEERKREGERGRGGDRGRERERAEDCLRKYRILP